MEFLKGIYGYKSVLFYENFGNNMMRVDSKNEGLINEIASL